ncbi:MAG: transposase [Candidatus Nomurabacteria bacterium]|nr:MAG: transposase [Candidatus Nomurabacteria bacterium]
MYLPEAVYFVTTVTKFREPFFLDNSLARLFIEQLYIAKKLKEFKLYAYVIMPDHVHILIEPGVRYSISKSMFTIKKQFAHEANRMLGWNDKRIINFSSAGEQTFVRLREFVNLHHPSYGQKFHWQKSFHDHVIRDQRDFNHHVNYLHLNPVKDGLVKKPEDWPYSCYDAFLKGDLL